MLMAMLMGISLEGIKGNVTSVQCCQHRGIGLLLTLLPRAKKWRRGLLTQLLLLSM